MYQLLLDTQQCKTYTKLSSTQTYDDKAKQNIVSQYLYLVGLGHSKTSASRALASLHGVHQSTIRKWSSNPKYISNDNVFLKDTYSLLESSVPLTFKDVSPAYAQVPVTVEKRSNTDKLVDAFIKLKSISLTLKFN